MRSQIRLLEEIREPIYVQLPCRSKIRKWAYENAYTLVLIAILFAITWVAMVVYGVTQSA
jgi:hypothetical protein